MIILQLLKRLPKLPEKILVRKTVLNGLLKHIVKLEAENAGYQMNSLMERRRHEKQHKRG